MYATLPFFPAMQRATSALLALTRAVLMAAGLLSIAALATIQFGGGAPLLERLQDLVAEGQPVPLDGPGSLWTLRGTNDAAPGDTLSPRMRGALDYVSRRYRVSGDVLEPIFATAEASGRELRLDPLLIVAVIAVESRFNPFSESVVGAQGLMQVMPRAHQDKLPEGAAELSFFDPVVNVRIGSRVLRESIRRHGSVSAGLQQFAGAADDPELRYAAKVLAEKARLEAAAQRSRLRDA